MGIFCFIALVFFGAFSGKTVLLLLSNIVLIGPMITGYTNYIGVVGDGAISNLIYAGISIQMLSLIAIPLFWVPIIIRKTIMWTRDHKVRV